MILHGVQPEELEKIFPLVTEWLSQIPRLAQKYGLQDVYTEVKTGNWQLWVFMGDEVDGVLLTTITQYPHWKELSLVGLAGRKMKQWLAESDKLKPIECFAERHECNAVVMVGARKGFTKIFKDYTADRVVLEKLL